ncbi:MAG: PrsW family intramembrane metalloprotease [Ktedonobacterales bacterium]|nr:PrsW family intramembrane metalloprotease [Ktedonobacterales bacterium]
MSPTDPQQGGAMPPGYPPASAYPQAAPNPGYGAPPAVAPGYPAYPNYGYQGYPGAPGYYLPFPNVVRAPRDNYRLVVGIICTVSLGLTLLGGALFAVILGVESSNTSLSIVAVLGYIALTAMAGGGVGLYFTIRALMGRPSATVRLPNFIIPLLLTVAVLAVGIVQYDAGIPQATPWLESPLLVLTGILPAVTIFTFAAQRLGFPTTWRRVWLSFLSGTFLAALIAIILEVIAGFALSFLLRADTGSLNVDASNASQVIGLLITVSVIAPLAEEGFKPIGPFIILWRLSGPAEAFLVGMAAGTGFAIFETIGYIGSGVGDWVVIAVLRIGAGLLHSVGAGMATLGWYYLLRGKGVAQRYAKGLGCLAYAVVQHGIFNGSTLLQLVPGPLQDLLSAPVWFFGLPMDGSFVLALVLYAGIATVLVMVTNALRKGASTPTPVPVADVAPTPAAQPTPAIGGLR